MQIKFSIVILSLNHYQSTHRLLNSLAITQGDYETILIDNGSSQEVSENIQRIEDTDLGRTLHLRSFFNSRNIGIASGRNQGARCSSGNVLVFLDNDTEIIRSDWLEKIAEVYQANTKLGTVGGVLLNPDRTVQFAGGSIDSRAHVRFQTTVLPEVSNRRTMFSLGACLSTPLYCWDELGGFDPQFDPMDYEDIDYCMRADRLGFPSYICQRCVLIHEAHTTTNAENNQFTRIKHYLRSGSRFLRRWRDTLEKNHNVPTTMG